MSKPIALYQEKKYFSKAIKFKLGWLSYLVRLVKFLEARASHGPGLSVTRSVGLSVCHTLADLFPI